MKVDIKPQIICVRDYHEFFSYDDKNFMQLGIHMNYYEFGFDGDWYNAVIWVDGDEESLFKFIMTNEEFLDLSNKERW